MKVTELIAKLAELHDEHGDLEVLASDFGCGCCGDLVTPDPHVRKLDEYDIIYWDTLHLASGTNVIQLNY